MSPEYLALLDLVVEAAKIEDCQEAVAALKAIPKSDVEKALATSKDSDPEAQLSEEEIEMLDARMNIIEDKADTCLEFFEVFSAMLNLIPEVEV
ncbi:MAG: hypothetical protein WC966_05620 [Bradymonadales bacterium]|jgi:hypothetical protein